ncbi:MAG TPA: S41 family peptidase [Candidatus Moranbacteria bacterium]|mgnify:CR=1 FL=1|nr:S41 family peptidase [Candidatus Moranbacteria bacterium]
MQENNFPNTNSQDISSQDEEKKTLEKNRKLFKKYLSFFALVFLLYGSFYLGFSQGKKNQEAVDEKPVVPISQSVVSNKFSNENKVDFSLFWRVWDLVREKHINKNNLDAQKMVYGAINGMLKATGDPYSNFFNPSDTKSFSQEIEGSFDGIGAELGVKDDVLTIVAPLEGSPAQKAGLRSGDKILKINNTISADMTADDAVDLIRGKKGTEVRLTILHLGDQETKEVAIIRDKIEIKSVSLENREDKIAYLKISKFGDNTAREFNEAANKIVSEGAKGIIIDMRNNPGGLLDKCVEIANKLIPKGKVIVTEEDSAGNKESLHTNGGDKLSSIPTVVLINEGSASASEILAGALRDNQGITLIGKKSFGKGSVQELSDLPGGASVKITVAKWMTPGGDYIMEKGISPDVEVDLSLDDYNNNRDPQFDKALEMIKEKIK